MSETLSLASNGNRALLFSSPNSGPNAQIDLNAIERIELAVDAFDGVAIFDLRGTGVAEVAIEIAPGETFLSSFSFQAVTATVNLVFAGDLDLIVVTGLGARVTIAGLDGVTLNSGGTSSFYAAGSAGNDSFDTSGLDESVDLDDGITLAGRGGIDTFILGEARESIDASGGTTGSSRVDYRHSNAPVAVILQVDLLGNVTGSGYGGHAAGDFYRDIYGATGSAFGDILSGGTHLEGLGGDDQLYASDAGATLSGGVANDFLQGGQSDDLLDGGIGNDTLRGGAGADVMLGGAGADIMIGGAGDDTYYVDDSSDAIGEVSGEGNDRIAASISLAPGARCRNRADRGGQPHRDECDGPDRLATSPTPSSATTASTSLRGQGGNDTLAGFGGNDFLVGGTGTDLMIGGTGDDTFYVDDASDSINEQAGEGNDRVAASVSYVLSNDAHIELLEAVNLTATDAFDLTGSDSANIVSGNNGVNVLRGQGGNDSLQGAGGDDFLVGGTGTDTMAGGTGNDTYYVDECERHRLRDCGRGNRAIGWRRRSITRFPPMPISSGWRPILSPAPARSTCSARASPTSFWATMAPISSMAGAAADTLTGLGGSDSFAFTTALGGGNVDTITGLQLPSTRSCIDDAIFAGVGTPGNFNTNAFTGRQRHHEPTHRIIYNSQPASSCTTPTATAPGRRCCSRRSRAIRRSTPTTSQ